MSAPDTNIETQARRHSAPLLGLKASLAFAGALLIALIAWTVWQGDVPREASVVDGRTGAVEQTD